MTQHSVNQNSLQLNQLTILEVFMLFNFQVTDPSSIIQPAGPFPEKTH